MSELSSGEVDLDGIIQERKIKINAKVTENAKGDIYMNI